MITILCSPQKKMEYMNLRVLRVWQSFLCCSIWWFRYWEAHIKETEHGADGFILPFVFSDLLLLSLKSNLGCMSNAFELHLGGNKINFRFHSSGYERESYPPQRGFSAPYRDYCLYVEFVRLDNECKSPPLDRASAHHLPARDKVRCSPNYESSLGESCCRVSALSPSPSHTFPKMTDSST